MRTAYCEMKPGGLTVERRSRRSRTEAQRRKLVRVRENIGAAMMLTGTWKGDGVFNMEQLDPDPFMDMLNKHGLPWTVEELDAPLAF